MGLELFLAFLLFPVSCPLAQEQKQSHHITCPKDFQCGNLGRLNFPFTNISQPDCGLCPVICQYKQYPKIKLHWFSDQTFEAISMMNNSIKLRDLQLQRYLNEQSCNAFYYGIYLPNSSSVSFKISSNTITLFRCSVFPNLIPETVDMFLSDGYRSNTSCDGFLIFYRNPKYYPSQTEYAPPGCSAVHLPMRSSDKVSKESKLFELLSFEFDLEWHLKNTGKNTSKTIIITVAAIAGGAFFNVLAIFLIWRYKKRIQDAHYLCSRPELEGGSTSLGKKFSVRNFIKFWKCETQKKQDLQTFLKNYGSLAPKMYHYSDVKKMTGSFKTKLGQGGYGSVYKGKLQDGSLVAVKVLKQSKGNGEEFINEVASISRTSHVNILTLLGFCFQGEKKALIYEFMTNGSLEKFIYEKKSLVSRQLEWSILYKIAVGIARGLEYLHCGCNRRILHFDIKPHNILLDEDFCPKISDFGLAKVCTRKESIISTMAARGTIGYIAPEVVCKNIGGVSHKSDVYSYGMMVLEMVGGRKNVDVGVDHTSEIYFPHWIYTRLVQGGELGLSGIMHEEENKQARKMLIVSLWCILTNPSSRPTIANVLEMLEGPLETLQMPPKPFLYSPSRASSEGSS